MPKTTPRRSLAPDGGSLGLSHSQNFISDAALVRRLLRHVRVGAADTIVEIGPGRGALTAALARLAPRLLAVEADPRLALALLERFAGNPRVTIAHGDFLDFPLPARPFVAVANIPFNRTAEIVHKLTGEQSGLQAAYLIMQHEAARKFSGQPDCPSSLLSLLLQVEFAVSIICSVPRGCFSPRPGVDAALALFRKRRAPLLSAGDARQYRDLLSYLYPRGPLLRAALRKVFSHAQLKRLLRDLELDGRQRLTEVTCADWLAIFKVFAGHSSPAARRKIHGAYARLSREQAALSKRHRTSQGKVEGRGKRIR